jgi:hypothetical protein
MLSVKDIAKIQNTKNSLRKEIYKTILTTFSKKIRTYVEMGQTQIFLTVPVMIVGQPSFDRKVARDYLMRQLKNLGYTVIPYQDFEIYVTWAVRPTQESHEPELGLPAFVNLHKVADLYRNKKH